MAKKIVHKGVKQVTTKNGKVVREDDEEDSQPEDEEMKTSFKPAKVTKKAK